MASAGSGAEPSAGVQGAEPQVGDQGVGSVSIPSSSVRRNAVCLEEPVYFTTASFSPEGVASDYWSTTFADCSGDARQLWNKIDRVMKPSTASQLTHSANDLATHFVGKVDKIRTNTASSHQSCVTDRSSTALSVFQLVTTKDVHRLVTRAPCKHCDLDPAPTWLVKCAVDILAPVVATICNASLQTGFSRTRRSKLESLHVSRNRH